MGIELADVPKSEFEGVFAAIKQGIYPYVESVFGWDDEFQRERLSRVTLSSFTGNQGALRFYERLGYKVVEGDKEFVSLSRPLFRKY